MSPERTCGMGIAESSTLPLQLSEVAAAVAENLERHMTTLYLEDHNSRAEHAAYEKLSKQYRDIAARLRATAEEMAGYKDLPMGRHDDEALISVGVVEAFRKLVDAEQELLALLTTRAEQHRQMLAMVDGTHARKEKP